MWGNYMSVTVPDYNEISGRVEETLLRAFGPNVAVQTDKGYEGRVFVRIVSKQFNGLSEKEKQDRIWDVLRTQLKEKSTLVALVMAFGTAEV